MTRFKAVLPLVLLLAVPTSAVAQEGLFLRFGLGPGVALETNAIHGNGLVMPAKDHAIGYFLTRRFAVHLADFGGLVHEKVGKYDYVNLDGLGLGCTARLSSNALVSVAVGRGQVAFAENWWEATGSDKDDGLAVNASLRREWPVSGRWALGVGTQASLFRSFDADYTFFAVSAVGSVSFHLKTR